MTGTEEPSTRDRLLNSFETLLVTEGSRATTLDAVAAHADVSKGGLLYHFHAKDELVDAMLERLREQAATDTERMRSAPEGPVLYYINTSVDSGSHFDRALIAAARIAQEQYDVAVQALAEIRAAWRLALEDHLGDKALAQTIQLIGDGLYFNDTFGQANPEALPLVHEVVARLLN